jgi:hypothetical protein
MKASTERKLVRWLHIVFSIPILGFIYGPVAEIPKAAFATRWVFLPAIILSGFWLWKGQWIKNRFKSNTSSVKKLGNPIKTHK